MVRGKNRWFILSDIISVTRWENYVEYKAPEGIFEYLFSIDWYSGSTRLSLCIFANSLSTTHFVLLLSRDRVIMYKPCDYFWLIMINRLVNEWDSGRIFCDSQLLLWFFRYDSLSFYQGTSRNRVVSLRYLRLRNEISLFFDICV